MDTKWTFEELTETFTAREKKFKKIRANIDEIIKEFLEKKPVHDAVNYADLKCNEIEQIFTESGEEYYRVIIDEASPDAYKFQQWVLEQLNKRGLENVLVMTEW